MENRIEKTKIFVVENPFSVKFLSPDNVRQQQSIENPKNKFL